MIEPDSKPLQAGARSLSVEAECGEFFRPSDELRREIKTAASAMSRMKEAPSY